MNRLGENDAGDADSDAEDPEQLLNEWLGELNTLTGVSGRSSPIWALAAASQRQLKRQHCDKSGLIPAFEHLACVQGGSVFFFGTVSILNWRVH